MIHVKDGVTCEGMKPQLLDALLQLVGLFKEYEINLLVTSISDGKHGPNSLHYKGYAVDLRTRDIPGWQQPHLLDAIHHLLGRDWDAIQEVDHYHLEFDQDHNGGKGNP